jgi:hypothetical protein
VFMGHDKRMTEATSYITQLKLILCKSVLAWNPFLRVWYPFAKSNRYSYPPLPGLRAK